MKINQKGLVPRSFSEVGEIATIVTLVTFFVIGVASLVSSVALKKPQTTQTKAADKECICQRDPDGFSAWMGNDCGNCSGVVCNPGDTFPSSCSTTSSTCPNKLDQIGNCNPACCTTDGDCKGPANQPQPQVCGVPNGYCLSGKSCAAVVPTTSTNQTPKAKYIRTCSGGTTCAWTYCDGVNFPYSECTELDPNVDPNSSVYSKYWKCNSDADCQKTTPTPAQGVNTCTNPYGKKESCPATYPQCYASSKAVIVHKDCTQSNTSGCVYWCEGKNGGRVGCDSTNAKTFEDPSCKAVTLPTVTPTPIYYQSKSPRNGCFKPNATSPIQSCFPPNVVENNWCCPPVTNNNNQRPVSQTSTQTTILPSPSYQSAVCPNATNKDYSCTTWCDNGSGWYWNASYHCDRPWDICCQYNRNSTPPTPVPLKPSCPNSNRDPQISYNYSCSLGCFFGWSDASAFDCQSRWDRCCHRDGATTVNANNTAATSQVVTVSTDKTISVPLNNAKTIMIDGKRYTLIDENTNTYINL